MLDYRRTLIALALVLLASPAHAGGEAAGTTAANFLSVGQGPAVLSMGGAGLASPPALDVAAWNVGALGRMDETRISLAHAALGDATAQEWLAAGGRVGTRAWRWGLSALYQSEGGFEGRDALNQPTGEFSVSDLALGLQLARPIGAAASVGVGLKWVNQSLGEASGSGLAFDAGVHGVSGPFGFGIAARNVGGAMRYEEGRFDMPAVLAAGVAWSHPVSGVRLALDAQRPAAYYDDVRAGIEWRWRDRVALRGGYRAVLGAPQDEALGGPTFGLGVGANGMWFDYAFLAGDGEAQGRHRFGLTLRPGMLRAPAIAGPLGAADTRIEEAPVATASPAANPVVIPAGRAAADVLRPFDTRAIHRDAASAAPMVIRQPRPAPTRGSFAVSRPVRVPKRAVPVLEPQVASAPAAPASNAPRPAAIEPVATTPPPAPAAGSVMAKPAASRASEVVVVPRRARASEPPPAELTSPTARPSHVVVQGGESLADIASRWGISVAAIMMDNNLVSDRVKPGQRLVLPAAGRR